MSDFAATGLRSRPRDRADEGARAEPGRDRGADASPFGERAPGRGVGKSRGAEKLIAALIAAIALVVVVASAAFVLPSVLRVTRYEVSGNAALSRDDILSAALIHDKEYFFSIDAERVKAALEAQPRIAEARVAKLFPNGLRIAVRERAAVAAALAVIGDKTAAVCLDAEGVAFAEATSEEAASVPVLSGIRFEGFRPGTKLPPLVAKLLASVGEIRSSEPALLSAISEIKIVASAQGEPELLIYPLNHRIPVRVGASLDAPTLRSIILVLDVLGTRGIADTVREIDFRSGRVVYSTKEGQPG
jgi:hypothetical protein